jgi:hypothetical protein
MIPKTVLLGLLVLVCRMDREREMLGDHAAGWVDTRHPGYHSRTVASPSPFKIRGRICSSRGAPRCVPAIGCFVPKRLLIT